jgi:hypothetical protein
MSVKNDSGMKIFSGGIVRNYKRIKRETFPLTRRLGIENNTKMSDVGDLYNGRQHVWK